MNLPPLIWKPSPNFYPAGDPHVAALDLLVLHDCESSYQSAVNTFLSEAGGAAGPVSAHLVLKEDGSEVTQMVSFADRGWHCRAFNGRSVGLEMAGFSNRGYSDSELQSAAVVMAYLCHALKIPVQWSHGGNGPGITTHFDLGKAGGGHADPSTDPHFFTAFMVRVQTAFTAGGFPASWGRGEPTVTTAPSSGPAVQTHAPIAESPEVANVRHLQASLNTLGAKPQLVVDGFYGDKTRAAILAFQARQQIFQDGIASPRTMLAIERALKSST